jgi:membrane fusion protein, heavy metal efflux system
MLALAVGVAGIGAWYLLGSEKQAPGPTPAAAPALPPGQFRLNESEIKTLRIQPVTTRAFRDERIAEGRISYNQDRSTPVYFPYNGGRVVRAEAKLGDTVRQGDVLMEVESNDLVQAVNTLLAAIDATNKSRTARDLAQRQAARAANLFAAKAGSQADLETAQANLRSAEAELRSSQTAEQAARDSLRVLGRTPDQITELERSRQVDAIIPLIAPLDGVVTQRRVGPGQWLSNGNSDPVFTIADISTMWLVAQVREMDVPYVRVGQPVEVTVGALPGQVFQARISNAASGINAETRRLTVRAEVQDPNHRLTPEMFATFRIEVGQPVQSVAVPVNAVIVRGSDPFVWVSPEPGLFELRRIRVGLRSEGMLQVTDGLKPGDNVVTGGALFIDRAARID